MLRFLFSASLRAEWRDRRARDWIMADIASPCERVGCSYIVNPDWCDYCLEPRRIEFAGSPLSDGFEGYEVRRADERWWCPIEGLKDSSPGAPCYTKRRIDVPVGHPLFLPGTQNYDRRTRVAIAGDIA